MEMPLPPEFSEFLKSTNSDIEAVGIRFSIFRLRAESRRCLVAPGETKQALHIWKVIKPEVNFSSGKSAFFLFPVVSAKPGAQKRIPADHALEPAVGIDCRQPFDPPVYHQTDGFPDGGLLPD